MTERRPIRKATSSIWSAIPLVTSFVLAISLCGSQTSADDISSKAAVAVVKASSRCFSRIVNATGYIVPRATAVVMFNAPGFRFVDVTLKEGDTVQRGDVVATAIPVGAPVVAGAETQKLPIKSLASGRILQRNIETGTLSSSSAGPLFVIATDGEMEALVDVPSVHVLELEPGQIVRISTDDGHNATGRVWAVPVEINRQTQVGQARLSLEASAPPMMGRFVHAAIEARRSCGVAVPLSALTHTSNGVRLQVVKGDTIETRSIKVGLLSETDAEVTDGVAEGDVVISDAGSSLQDGDKVSPIFADNVDSR